MFPKKVKQPDGLLSVLLDKAASLGDRDDAAMDLGEYDQVDVEKALIKVACDHMEDEDLIDSVGESLWEIWKRKDKFSKDIIENMHPEAQKYFNDL